MRTPAYLPAVLLACLGFLQTYAFAGSATWTRNPHSNNWNTATNWTPATVPNGPSDTATFASSSQISILLSAPAEVNALMFQPRASAFTITTPLANIFTISGAGIVNNSGVTQRFVADQDEFSSNGGFQFTNDATAGSDTDFTCVGGSPFYGSGGEVFFNDSASADHASFDLLSAPEDGLSGGQVWFADTSTASEATFSVHGGAGFPGNLIFTGSATAANANIVVEGGLVDVASSANLGNATITVTAGATQSQGHIYIQDNASAGNAMLIHNGGTMADDILPYTQFTDAATAGNATLICNGGIAEGAGGGFVLFKYATPTAGNATLVANGGTNGGGGGLFLFDDGSLGGTARIELFGNGNLDISNHDAPGITAGSIEGDGLVLLGSNNLTTGNNNLSTTFSGVIQDGGSGGSLTQMGAGKLILTNANTYTGGTTVNGGTLLVANISGSGTGTGPVQAFAGILGGTGVITGRVTLGRGHGTGITLGPGANSVIPGTLTIQKQVALKSDATYRVTINSSTPAADEVIANGIRILGAQIVFNEVGSAVLPLGMVFTVIGNTGSKPIGGIFANLPDGDSVTVGSNTFQANYEGGDGNDLTLTVVP